MANTKAISSDEQRWRAEEDARTLARYNEIVSDKKRLGSAVKVAKSQYEDLNKRATAMKKVANKK